MGVTAYLIVAESGKPPIYYLVDPHSMARTQIPDASVPSRVVDHGAQLSALADGRPLPPGHPPPAVFAPAQPGGPFTALIRVESGSG